MSLDKAKIVRTKAEDVYGIRKIQRLTWLDTYPNEEFGITRQDVVDKFAIDGTDGGRQKIEDRKKLYSDPSVCALVAKDQDRIVGFCMVKKEVDRGQIMPLYILPEYQGMGLGKRLISRGIGWLGDKRPIYVNVVTYNSRAIGFYKSCGFTKTDKEVHDTAADFPSGRSTPEIEMVLRA